MFLACRVDVCRSFDATTFKWTSLGSTTRLDHQRFVRWHPQLFRFQFDNFKADDASTNDVSIDDRCLEIWYLIEKWIWQLVFGQLEKKFDNFKADDSSTNDVSVDDRCLEIWYLIEIWVWQLVFGQLENSHYFKDPLPPEWLLLESLMIMDPTSSNSMQISIIQSFEQYMK